MKNKQGSSKRILIIDDDQIVLKLLTIVFDGLGHSDILSAQNGAEALDLLTTQSVNIDLLVLDLMMPQMDGIQFLQELVTIKYPGSVLLMSGTNSRILSSLEKLKSKQLNIIGAIEKPLTPAKLKPILLGMDNQVEPAKVEHLDLISEQSIAHGLDNGEFIPFFQPKVELRSNRVVAYEALARWQNSSGEIITPIHFIPQAEATGQIFDIDMMILEKTCRIMMEWQNIGIELIGSVNLSATSLNCANAAETILDITQRYGLHLAQLVFELTETVLIKETNPAMENILRLHLYGANISMDDFGTGYSGMQYLQQIPFTELKIDKCFIHGSLLDRSKNAIVESSVELARKLGLKTICEGVETYEDLRAVEAVGADMGQGYYFSHPLPAEKFLQWVNDHTEDQTRRKSF